MLQPFDIVIIFLVVALMLMTLRFYVFLIDRIFPKNIRFTESELALMQPLFWFVQGCFGFFLGYIGMATNISGSGNFEFFRWYAAACFLVTCSSIGFFREKIKGMGKN
ncbi:MAG: hypothetical protein Q7S09_00235 [bacterium]|nr:hypothetical protein [bacterium]